MLPPNANTVRLFLHVLAVSVWVGGQIALAGVVPSLRRAAPEATKVVANAFARVAWPAFAIAVATGIWSIMERDVTSMNSEEQVTLMVHVSLAISSGLFVAVHSFGKSKVALAVGGALGLLTALGAMFVGILLHG